MGAWLIWLLAAVALAAGEVVTTGFVLGPIALAAIVAALVAALGGGLVVQMIVFIAGSVATIALLRPIAQRHLRTPSSIRTGTAALVGARAVALERVDDDGGRVKIGGETWTARSYVEGQVIEPGTRVEVAKIEGATALVYE
ncbi:MAG: NfeD family protein [Actinobacteria bacterium]|nr:NfeD family protein [Actinomycetota bacterium]